MIKEEITIKRRLGSMLLDHIVISFLLVPLWLWFDANVFPLLDLANINIKEYSFYGFMFIYFNKDIVQGRSIAKRITGLQVIERKSNMPANGLQCFLRNITIPIWIVEVIFALFSPARRLGDYIAQTEVVSINRKLIINKNMG